MIAIPGMGERLSRRAPERAGISACCASPADLDKAAEIRRAPIAEALAFRIAPERR